MALCWSVTWPETVPVDVDWAQAEIALRPRKTASEIDWREKNAFVFVTPSPVGLSELVIGQKRTTLGAPGVDGRQPFSLLSMLAWSLPTTLIKAVKGTRDLLPPSTEVWNRVESVTRAIFRVYNYHEIRTPILEETQLFARGVGQETDIVTKEMYTFTDRDDSSLTLRPENTAPVIRAYIEHRLDQRPGVQKLYYIGPMFRRERPQKGRYRQFFQIGAEAIGSETAGVAPGGGQNGVGGAKPPRPPPFQPALHPPGAPPLPPP